MLMESITNLVPSTIHCVLSQFSLSLLLPIQFSFENKQFIDFNKYVLLLLLK